MIPKQDRVKSDEIRDGYEVECIEYSNNDIRTVPFKEDGGQVRKRRPYRSIPNLPSRIISMLARGRCGEDVSRLLEISKSQVNRYKEIALRLKILTEVEGCYPKMYEKGPRFYLRKERGWWSCSFEPILCRIHYGQGSPYDVQVLSYKEFESLPYRQDDGTVINRPLFNRHTQEHGYILSKCSFPVPSNVLGKECHVYLEARNARGDRTTLYIGPPPIERTFAELEAIANIEEDKDPFKEVLAHIRNELLHHGKWVLDEIRCHAPIHYAIDRSIVERLCPELLQGVHKLRRSDNEEDYGLFTDKSTFSGELETSYSQIARDVLGILETERRNATGFHGRIE